MNITFTTPRGAKVTIRARELGGFDADVNGKAHTSSAAAFIAADVTVGAHVLLAGNVKAQVPADMIEAVTLFFATAREAQKVALAAAKSGAAKTYAVENRMRDMHSRYSVN